MIARIVSAEPWRTATGHHVIKLQVIDDTEWYYWMYFSIEAPLALNMLCLQTGTPVIRKMSESHINIARMVGKLISVNRETVRYKDRVWPTLMIDMRWANRMWYLKSGLNPTDLY